MSKMPSYTSTTNACKLCRPLGAALAFRGIEGSVPFLHGSQGCATYMRRYIISHFNEPIDIASSALGEKNAIFGGGPNLKLGLKNVIEKYRPQLIGIATTCLTETIGDDVAAIVKEFSSEAGSEKELPHLVHVASPSYSGSHMEGFHDAVLAAVQTLTGKSEPGMRSRRITFHPPACEGAQGAEDAEPCVPLQDVNLLPGFVSPADLRYLKEVLVDFGLPATLLPDISETLDGPALSNYPLIPAGGTPITAIKAMGKAAGTIEFGYTLAERKTAGTFLEERFGVPLHRLGMPIGIRETDRFMQILAEAAGRPLPSLHANERGRLVDALVDGHKYLAGKTVVIYGEEDLVVGLTAFLTEIGVRPLLCASGGNSGNFEQAVRKVVAEILAEKKMPQVVENVDFHEIGEQVEALRPDLLMGHSKGYSLARKMNIPLIRVGFPIHDRLGGQRILHLGYRGAQQLFDTVVNTVIAGKQGSSPVGYSYM